MILYGIIMVINILGLRMYKTFIIDALKKQKEALFIPYEAIASRSGVSIATVKRVFKGNDVSLTSLDKIAVALDCEINIKPKHSPKSLYKMQVEKKAQELVNRVLHTSALEEQALDSEAERKMISKAKTMIMKMPKSQVWG